MGLYDIINYDTGIHTIHTTYMFDDGYLVRTVRTYIHTAHLTTAVVSGFPVLTLHCTLQSMLT